MSSAKNSDEGAIMSVVDAQSASTTASMIGLLTTHSSDAVIVKYVAAIMKNPSDYESHNGLKTHLLTKPIDEHTLAYADEFHEMMYEKRIIIGRVWLKLGTDEIHCAKKGLDGMTLPAMLYKNGCQAWYQDGKRFRDDKDANGQLLPTFVGSNGAKYWYKDEEFHRDEKDANGMTLPAKIDCYGNISWMQNGILHRDDVDANGHAMPTIVTHSGDAAWHKNGKRHREDKDENGITLPAVIFNQEKLWYQNGDKHRGDISIDPKCKHFGKALPASVGETEEWYFMGQKCSQESLTKVLIDSAAVAEANASATADALASAEATKPDLIVKYGISEQDGELIITGFPGMRIRVAPQHV